MFDKQNKPMFVKIPRDVLKLKIWFQCFAIMNGIN
jgi:hypothetical protein